MAGETDPTKVLGYAFTHAPDLGSHQIGAALNIAGLGPDSTDHTHPIRIQVPSREIVHGGLSVEQRAARAIADLHPAGTGHGDFFREENHHLL